MHSAEDPASGLIFVSIASYRDRQLAPTIGDCIAKAQCPDRLRFGICWQHGPEEPSIGYGGDCRFRILDVDYRESRGACWARAEIMKLWGNEAWFLQIDSHCRFAPAWDQKLLRQVALTGSEKPILSTYASPFTPNPLGTRELLAGAPQLMAISSFHRTGIPHLKPVDIPDWKTRKSPLRARFLAAGYLFTQGSFVEEVAYDPSLYFFGEEIAMTLRAYTHGYDLFHPHELLVWHDYERSNATRHWDDHPPESQAAYPRRNQDDAGREKVLSLLQGKAVGSFGLGSSRTLADYETYAGISFSSRKIQDYTRRSLQPPNPPVSPDWIKQIYPWLVRILLDPKQLSPAAFEDPAFWYLTIQDEQRNEIYRHDFSAAELAVFSGSEPAIALVCELESGIVPVYWTVWPVSKRRGWMSKIEGKLGEDDFGVISED